MAVVALLIAGSFANNFFLIAPATYVAVLSAAYLAGVKISNHGLNVAYNWSIKWTVFVVFLVLTGTYLQNAFVYAMFSYILINIALNPVFFIHDSKAVSNG